MNRKRTRILLLAALSAAAILVAAAGGALGANPSGATVSMDSPTANWAGGPFVASNPAACLGASDPTCDHFLLTVDRPADANKYRVDITVSTANTGNDFDVFVYGPDGEQVDSATNSGTPPERVSITDAVDGTYEVRVQPWLVDPGTSYQASATLSQIKTTVPPTDPNSVLHTFDATAAEAKAEVPLRVVLVGFGANELDESKLTTLIPDSQRPSVLIPRAENDVSSCDDGGFLFGANTLINHGRCYIDEKPYLVPWEFEWAPQVIHAPASFANGLFDAMRANSTTGELSGATYKEHLERYNATRGVFRGLDKQVAPGTAVRFIDAEKVEDWIAQNARQHLGFEIGARSLSHPGRSPGYTVFVLNTWDSPAALTQLQPQHEYHLWKIVRIDPDTGRDEGVDWARVWGGRYREMIIDLGAAPNPYESESWGNRGRSVFGSESYDPPLWEFRADAPRPVVPGDIADPQRFDQAINPGATWDKESLEYMLGRFVNEAASFRFLHSYLYEPRPQTGKYYLSSNIWHDFHAQTPWPSDLKKLYDEQAVLAGLRTLVPYFEFTGDTQYKDLELTDPDQAMLDQAKRDGDDIAGASGTAMNTVTAMNYFDASDNRSRFYRGGSCFTTIPNLNVVVEKHYAWALPVIVAGIAPDAPGKPGVPWGFLASVNDIFKWPGADKETITKAAHPDAMAGTFSYTAIHELSHYLGLAHPHDTIGASKIDGETVYWSGFTWTFNSTAAPTTYSHDELAYSILDQENVARGHTAYYLRWANEAIAEAGDVFAATGKETLDELDAKSRNLRTKALATMDGARRAFAQFRFIPATFSAKRAWSYAAAYRDRALGLSRGTTEIQKGTKLTGAEACASAQVE